ncbi:MAG TPA: nucleoside-diphosphate sugar epimerase/dehydratase [Thermoanaerobaculia bacterium]|nr:nucleoside-diphosphate sugar epimerase/dehydratase [Thermoanaerobaculia bacterium]
MNQNEHVSSNEPFFARSGFSRRLLLIVVHAIVFAAAYAFAWLVRFEFAIPPDYLQRLQLSAPLIVAVQLLIGVPYGFYRSSWRYVGMQDVIRQVLGMTTALVLLMVSWYVSPMFLDLPERLVFRAPRGVLLIDWAFVLLTLFGARMFVRMSHHRFRSEGSSRGDTRVLIVGAGDAGESLARAIEHRPQIGMKVVGFIDDQRIKRGTHIRGISVHGPISNVGQIADDLNAEEALIAIPSASGKRMREIIHHLSSAELKFKTIPGIENLVSGKLHVTQLRPVNVEDLLRRKRIDLPGQPVQTLFHGKRVLVTGAGGTIGSELSVQVAAFEPESLALVERSEFALYEVRKRLTRAAGWVTSRITSNLVDICDTSILEELIARERPQIVLHAAAHKHVPIGEENPAEYLRNNCLATRKLAELCEAYGVERFVFISTDKAINPSSVMGVTKRAAEIALLDVSNRSKMKATAVRFGNVIGSSGSVIPLFLEQIAAGGPVTVTHPDVTRYFIRTSEAVSLVLQAATLGDGGNIFMLDMGEPVKVVDLARDLIRLSNHTEAEMPIVFTGLRQGEKLFEEIRLHGESIVPTVHPQIVVTKAPQPDAAHIERWLKAAERVKSREDSIQLMKSLVPEYVPSVATPAPVPAVTVAPLPVGRELLIRPMAPASDRVTH